jgi:hypothetical protein
MDNGLFRSIFNLSINTSKCFFDISIPIHLRPVFLQAKYKEPEPKNGSNIVSPGLVVNNIILSNNLIGI